MTRHTKRSTTFGRHSPAPRGARRRRAAGELHVESLEPRLALATGLLDTLVSVVDEAGTNLLAQGAAVAEGGQLVARVALSRRPDAPVTVALAMSDRSELTVSTSAITFTAANWNVPREVVFQAVDDGVADGNQAVAARLSISTMLRRPVVKSVPLTAVDVGAAAAITLADVSAAVTGAAQAASALTVPSAPVRRKDFNHGYAFTVRYLPRFQTFAVQTSALANGRVNKLIAPASPMTPAYKSVVAINVDTLYTSATVNVSQGPQILTIPDYSDSYSVIVVDGFGTVLQTGLKNTPEGGTYALVSPSYRGPLPLGVSRINVRADWTQLAIRTSRYTQTADGTGYTDTTVQAEAFRRATRLQSLNDWLASPGSGGETQVLPIQGNFSFPMKSFVDTSVQGDPQAFLETLDVAMRSPTTGPLSPSDRTLIANFTKRFEAAKADAANGEYTRLSDIVAGARAAHNAIVERWRFQTTGNNWVHFNNIGNWGRSYLDRAAGNLYLQYGNVRTAAYYAQAFLDNRNHALSGANGQVYTITFAANQIPQCERFWSITAYTGDAIELVPNAANKYAVASYTPGLVTNPDGSITVTLRTIGGSETTVDPNVLPIPAGVFSVMLRVYAPLGVAKSGTYVPPAVIAVLPPPA